MKKTILRGLAIGAFAIGLAAQPVRADITSSMTAELVGGDIIFLLNATQPGTFWLHDVTMYSSDWLFDGNAANVAIREGGEFGVDRTANYGFAFVDGNLTFESNSAIAAADAALAPVWIRVGLASAGANLTDIEYGSPSSTSRGEPLGTRFSRPAGWETTCRSSRSPSRPTNSQRSSAEWSRSPAPSTPAVVVGSIVVTPRLDRCTIGV